MQQNQTNQAQPQQNMNPILSRLLEEVRNDKATIHSAYDRTHNRHNRGQ